MDAFALEVLEDAKSWNWPMVQRLQRSSNEGGKFNTLAPDFLYWLIRESQAETLGGTLLDQFWGTVGKCHNKLNDNSASHSSILECQGPIPIYS
jgi:hypothetical protein